MPVPLHLDGLIALTRRALGSALAMGRESEQPLFAVDCTAGNGHDTLFLAREAGSGVRVWAFDIQEAAIVATRERLAAAGPDVADRVTLVHGGHEGVGTALPPGALGRVLAVTFNLGYLPGSDKRVVTQPDTTLAALGALFPLVAVGGVVSVHVYQGQSGGEAEVEAVACRLHSLPWDEWRVAEYSFANKSRNREVLFLAEKIG